MNANPVDELPPITHDLSDIELAADDVAAERIQKGVMDEDDPIPNTPSMGPSSDGAG